MKEKFRRILAIFACVLFLVTLWSRPAVFADDETEETAEEEQITEEEDQEEVSAKEKKKIKAKKVTLNIKKTMIGAGQKLRLEATVKPANSTDKIKWSSSNTEIATVSQKGLVKAKARGKVRITATASSGKKASCIIKIRKAPERVRFHYTEKTVRVKDTFTLKALLPKGSFRQFTWKSSDPTVAKVDEHGKVTAKHAGEATITVKTYNGLKATCTVTVLPKTKKITMSRNKLSLKLYNSADLSVTFQPEGAQEDITWYTSDGYVAEVDQDGTVTAVGLGTAVITAETGISHKKAKCTVEVYNKMVALTFDDGPSIYTPGLLDGLAERGAHCTFFMVGTNASRYPDTVARIYNEGHELGNHSWDHPKMTTLSWGEMVSQISRQNNAVYNACGAYPTLFRSPYGSYNATVLNAANLPHILWSVDPRDWERPGQSVVTQRIVNNARDGSIILCHDIHPATPQAALDAIDILMEQGYKFVTVTELLTRNGRSIYPGETYSNGY